jgi:imidazole glycerol-phosphate synthase subunit HisH
LQDEVPVLGVCVGMQIMANGSDEGKEAGLGWIPGRVERFRDEWFNTHTHLPHMGWNDVELVDANALMTGLVKPTFYFLHSYFFRPVDENYVIARTLYVKVFAAAIQRVKIGATQLPPDTPHDWGVGLLANFAKV